MKVYLICLIVYCKINQYICQEKALLDKSLANKFKENFRNFFKPISGACLLFLWFTTTLKC